MAEITTDILLSCADENRRGGIKRVFVANKDDITSFTASTDDHSYTAVTLEATDDVWCLKFGSNHFVCYTLRFQVVCDVLRCFPGVAWRVGAFCLKKSSQEIDYLFSICLYSFEESLLSGTQFHVGRLVNNLVKSYAIRAR